MHCTCRTLLQSVLTTSPARSTLLPPSFLIPAFSSNQTTAFSTSTHRPARRDGNPARGISALHRSGQNRKQKLSAKLKDLPQPVLDPDKRSRVVVDPDHGLWGFFNPERTSLFTPTQMQEHGRGWTVPELRRKDWDDLHRLWWVCTRERNMLATQRQEINRIKDRGRTDLYGEHEAQMRTMEVSRTMKSVRFVLVERWYAWQNAREAAMLDAEVDLFADMARGEKVYVPREDANDYGAEYGNELSSSGSENDDGRTDTKDQLSPTVRSSGEEARL